MNVDKRKGELTNVCDSYLEHEIHPSTFLLDFLPQINKTQIDQQIFSSWKDYFKELRVPYIITKVEKEDTEGVVNTSHVLWKERKA